MYIYQADTYCDKCGEDICRQLGEKTSNAYVQRVNGGEADYPDHCGSHEDCLDAEVLPSGNKVGHFFGNELTMDGIKYLEEKANEGITEVVQLWLDYYSKIYNLHIQKNIEDCENDDEVTYNGRKYIVGNIHKIGMIDPKMKRIITDEEDERFLLPFGTKVTVKL